MAQLFLNNCYGVLDTPAAASDTTLVLTQMHGFPDTMGEGDWFTLTVFADSSRYGVNIEVVKVTAIDDTLLTVERGYEGDAVAHGAGERVEARLTADAMQRLRDLASLPSWEVGDVRTVAVNTKLPDDWAPLDGRTIARESAAGLASTQFGAVFEAVTAPASQGLKDAIEAVRPRPTLTAGGKVYTTFFGGIKIFDATNDYAVLLDQAPLGTPTFYAGFFLDDAGVVYHAPAAAGIALQRSEDGVSFTDGILPPEGYSWFGSLHATKDNGRHIIGAIDSENSCFLTEVTALSSSGTVINMVQMGMEGIIYGFLRPPCAGRYIEEVAIDYNSGNVTVTGYDIFNQQPVYTIGGGNYQLGFSTSLAADAHKNDGAWRLDIQANGGTYTFQRLDLSSGSPGALTKLASFDTKGEVTYSGPVLGSHFALFKDETGAALLLNVYTGEESYILPEGTLIGYEDAAPIPDNGNVLLYSPEAGESLDILNSFKPITPGDVVTANVVQLNDAIVQLVQKEAIGENADQAPIGLAIEEGGYWAWTKDRVNNTDGYSVVTSADGQTWARAFSSSKGFIAKPHGYSPGAGVYENGKLMYLGPRRDRDGSIIAGEVGALYIATDDGLVSPGYIYSSDPVVDDVTYVIPPSEGTPPTVFHTTGEISGALLNSATKLTRTSGSYNGYYQDTSPILSGRTPFPWPDGWDAMDIIHASCRAMYSTSGSKVALRIAVTTLHGFIVVTMYDDGAYAIELKLSKAEFLSRYMRDGFESVSINSRFTGVQILAAGTKLFVGYGDRAALMTLDGKILEDHHDLDSNAMAPRQAIGNYFLLYVGSSRFRLLDDQGELGKAQFKFSGSTSARKPEVIEAGGGKFILDWGSPSIIRDGGPHVGELTETTISLFDPATQFYLPDVPTGSDHTLNYVKIR
ncbi:hypothetical protein QD172_01750 [Cobetia sp. 10Alg 146]|uniref:hypothetical protein n=1 Tax=Cobetia sp. 10Alg 146 TaxID=3040019 RepID=UPI00244C4464|nr:hypothetical protein [Cobetia sp. 10Alg 146]MDH2289974.1 hypothetical protein [Cobetia sp. 10Alg 146]